MFAIGVIVPAGSDSFCVFLPAEDGRTIDTYLGFLKEPPQSIAVKLFKFCPATTHEAAKFITAPTDPFRIDLSASLPNGTRNAEAI
jgi:hypothetical protein